MTRTKKLTLCAIFTALALGLSFAERLIPLPIFLPGIKLGLANVVTLVALCILGKGSAFAILTARCLLGSLFGGLTGLAFSLSGGLVSLGVMTLALGSKKLSLYGVSVLGAAAHNIAQILVAMGLMASPLVGAYLPWLLVASVVTGLLTGGVCAGVLRVLPREVAR